MEIVDSLKRLTGWTEEQIRNSKTNRKEKKRFSDDELDSEVGIWPFRTQKSKDERKKALGLLKNYIKDHISKDIVRVLKPIKEFRNNKYTGKTVWVDMSPNKLANSKKKFVQNSMIFDDDNDTTHLQYNSYESK